MKVNVQRLINDTSSRWIKLLPLLSTQGFCSRVGQFVHVVKHMVWGNDTIVVFISILDPKIMYFS